MIYYKNSFFTGRSKFKAVQKKMTINNDAIVNRRYHGLDTLRSFALILGFFMRQYHLLKILYHFGLSMTIVCINRAINKLIRLMIFSECMKIGPPK